MQESTFRCYVEIPLYVMSLVSVSVLSCTTLIQQKLLNPSPNAPYCLPNSYPDGCNLEDNPECRGETQGGSFWTMYLITLAFASFTMLLTMSLVVHSFCRNERRLLKLVKKNDQTQDEDEDEKIINLNIAQKQTGIITRQALMYVVAFVMSWIFGFLEYLGTTGTANFTDEGLKLLHILRMIFTPSQGTFNLMIFLYQKVHVLRSSCDEDMPLMKAIGIIVFRPQDMAEAMPISNLNAGIDEYFHTSSKTQQGQLARGAVFYDDILDPIPVQDGDILSDVLSFERDETSFSYGLSVEKSEAREHYKGLIIPRYL